jgi:hypothetical protein
MRVTSVANLIVLTWSHSEVRSLVHISAATEPCAELYRDVLWRSLSFAFECHYHALVLFVAAFWKYVFGRDHASVQQAARLMA